MSGVTAEELIRLLNLQPHPEGGYYKETYRAAGTIPRAVLPNSFRGDRAYSTAIYYLLPEGARSRLHRLAADEIWHFYLGGPLTLAQILPGGSVERVDLGPDPVLGHRLQHAVPAGSWFGARCNPAAAFSLVGCTLAPGFDFAEFEIGDKDRLIQEFPGARGTILEFL